MENLMQNFPVKSYNVTNIQKSLGMLCCGWTTETLVMEEEEVVYRVSNCCTKSAQRRPYAQLNIVDHRRPCWNICHGLSTDFAKVDEEGKGGIVPGCGCDEALVKEIVDELNERKNGRGNIAQIRQQSYMIDRISKLKVQLPVLLQEFGVVYPPDDSVVERIFGSNRPMFRPLAEVLGIEQRPQEFDTMELDVTCCCEVLCCTSKKLSLGPDEMVFTTISGITRDKITETRPYANIDSVEAVKSCFCFSAVSARQNGEEAEEQGFMPGTGCNAGLVEQIRNELQTRVTARGQVGQIQQLGKMMVNVHDLAAEMPLLLHKLGLETAYPPSMQTMADLYGPSAPQELAHPTPHKVANQRFPEKNYDIQNRCSLCCALVCSCGIAGCTKTNMTLTEEEVVLETVNNCTQSVNRMPYGQLGSVDDEVCCGLHSVNGIMPGWGCNEQLVKEISNELQARKVGRGNIAQLRSQENTMYKALELDVRTDLLLRHLAIAYPPPQAKMISMYGPDPPTLPSDEAERGSGIHIKASERLETKEWTVTNCCDTVCCCQTKTLELNDEESVLTTRGPLCRSTVREPYAQMGSVEKNEACCGVCVDVQTDAAMISPNCGCSQQLVEEIGNELQHRKEKRGNIAQIKQQENLMIELIKLGVKLDLVAGKKHLQYPPSQETMEKVFGPGAQVPSGAQDIVEAVSSMISSRPSITTMEVSVPLGASGGQFFRVKGPRGSFQAEVPHGAVAGEKITVEVPHRSAARVSLLNDSVEMATVNG